jgi:putative membrane protein
MSVIAKALVLFVAIEHIAFLVLEMFLWTKPQGRAVFRTTPEQAEATKVLAANQGLYNGFLAAGLLWAALVAPPFAKELAIFFLGCVIVAGVFGAFTVNTRILFVQAAPAVIALAAVLWT